MSRTVVGGVVIARFPSGSHQKCGIYQRNPDRIWQFQTSKIWQPLDAYKVPGSFNVRAGKKFTKHNPNIAVGRFRNHFYTLKYAALLARHRPDLYVQLQGLDPAGMVAQRLFNNHIALKLRGEL